MNILAALLIRNSEKIQKNEPKTDKDKGFWLKTHWSDHTYMVMKWTKA